MESINNHINKILILFKKARQNQGDVQDIRDCRWAKPPLHTPSTRVSRYISHIGI
jgi:hypothetical protein